MSFNPNIAGKRIVGALVTVVVLAAVSVVWWTTRLGSDSPPQPSEFATGSDEVAAYQQLCRAKQAADEGRFKEALESLDRIARESTNATYKWDAEINAALAMANLKRVPEAMKRIDRIIAECPLKEEIPNAHIVKAEVCSIGGQHEVALRLLEEVVRTNTDVWPRVCEDALVSKAVVSQRLGQGGLTRATLDRIILDYPGAEDSQRRVAEKQLQYLTETCQQAQSERVKSLVADKVAVLLDRIGGTETTLKAPGPYLVTSLLSVPHGAVLMVEAGTEIQFGVRGGLRVEGRLMAAGSEGKPIEFAPLDGDADRNWWRGIQYKPLGKDSVCRLAFCRIAGAEVGLEILAGQAEADHCVFDRCGRAAVTSDGGSRVALKSCRFERSRRLAVQAEAGSGLLLDDCVILEAVSFGMVLQETTADSEIRRTVVEKCGRDGILVRGRSSVSIDGCQIRENHENGVEAIENASPTIVHTSLEKNGGNGVWVEGRSEPVIEFCGIAQNRKSGVVLEARSGGRINRNRIEGNRENGLVLRLDCTTAITANTFSGNGQIGLLLRNSQPPTVTGNSFEKNGVAALRNEGPGKIQALGNWWGSAAESEVLTVIQGQPQQDDWGPVEHAPWLEKAPPLPASKTAN